MGNKRILKEDKADELYKTSIEYAERIRGRSLEPTLEDCTVVRVAMELCSSHHPLYIALMGLTKGLLIKWYIGAIDERYEKAVKRISKLIARADKLFGTAQLEAAFGISYKPPTNLKERVRELFGLRKKDFYNELTQLLLQGPRQ